MKSSYGFYLIQIALISLNSTSLFTQGIDIDSVKGSGEQAIKIKYAAGKGITIGSTGSDGITIGNAAGDGMFINNTPQYGLRIFSAGIDGILIHSADSDGVQINSSENNGVLVGNAGSNGVHVNTASEDGLYVNNTGDDGIHINQAGNHGFYVDRAQNDGVRVDDADDDGIHINDAGDDGIYINEAGGDGVHVRDSNNWGLNIQSDKNGGNITRHIAQIYNRSVGGNADVLALKVGLRGNPISSNNFITFYRGNSTSLGAIEGNGSGGIVFSSNGSDFAEYLPKSIEEEFQAGDIVGVHSGKKSHNTFGAAQIMVITDRPAVLGNEPENLDNFEKVSFIGQVPVRVRGKVSAGDWIVASNLNDGTGIAVSPSQMKLEYQIVGQA